VAQPVPVDQVGVPEVLRAMTQAMVVLDAPRARHLEVDQEDVPPTGRSYGVVAVREIDGAVGPEMDHDVPGQPALSPPVPDERGRPKELAGDDRVDHAELPGEKRLFRSKHHRVADPEPARSDRTGRRLRRRQHQDDRADDGAAGDPHREHRVRLIRSPRGGGKPQPWAAQFPTTPSMRFGDACSV